MNKEILKKYIRSVVREELQSILKTELREHLLEMIGGNMTTSPSIPRSKQTYNSAPPTKKQVKYTNNELLNEVLNETKGGIPQEGSYVGYSEPLYSDVDNTVNIDSGENYLRDAYAQAYSQEYPDVIQPHKIPHQQQQHSDPNVRGVMNVLNRDFSGVMKKVDEKVKNRK